MSAGHQEVVMFLNAAEEIVDEYLFDDFESELLTGEARLEAHAASSAKAVYCVVGSGLTLVGAVYFLVAVDENGGLDQGFNLPLRYLARQAGVNGELEHGGVRLATRGKCAVPWHSLNLWEPTSMSSQELLEVLQQRVYRNRLKLRHVANNGVDVFGDSEPLGEVDTSMVEGEDFIALSDFEEPASTPKKPPAAAEKRPAADLETHELTQRLNEVFGQAGKLSMQDLIRLHSEQLAAAKERYRNEVENNQSTYLDQLKTYRSQIHDLKVALRQEQSRNRRLQAMLRGDP